MLYYNVKSFLLQSGGRLYHCLQSNSPVQSYQNTQFWRGYIITYSSICMAWGKLVSVQRQARDFGCIWCLWDKVSNLEHEEQDFS